MRVMVDQGKKTSRELIQNSIRLDLEMLQDKLELIEYTSGGVKSRCLNQKSDWHQPVLWREQHDIYKILYVAWVRQINVVDI